MSESASFIPPNVTPPDPPVVKMLALLFSLFMSGVLIVFIGFICVDFIADFVDYPLPHDALLAEKLHEECGPFISDFIGMHFPGQYAAKFGKNSRFDNYDLTETDQERAVVKLQEMFQNTEGVSVEIIGGENLQRFVSERQTLLYDADLATELCGQADLIGNTHISPLDYRLIPDIVITFYPSEIKFNIIASPPTLTPVLYISLGEGMQRWEGGFSGFMVTLLNARLRRGDAVHSWIATRLPTFPLDWVVPQAEEE